MLQTIEAYLREHQEAFALSPLPAYEPLRAAIITGGATPPRSKLILLWWRGSASLPCLVAKCARHARYNRRLEDEYAALCRLQEYVPNGAMRVPRPLGSDVRGGLRIAVESVLPGRQLRAAIREHPDRMGRRLSEYFPFSRWLGSLHARSARPASHADIERLVFAPLATAEQIFEVSSRERDALARLRAAAAALAIRVPLPLVFAHGDVDTSNIIVDAAGHVTGLVDWESGGRGLPLLDLAYFLARYAYEAWAAGQTDHLRGFRELFFDTPPGTSHRFGPRLVSSWFDTYVTDVVLAPEWLPILFALTWIMHARHEQEKEAMVSLPSEGPVLYGKPAAAVADTAGEVTLAQGHFRSHLRYYLEHLDACAALTRLAMVPR